MPSPSFMVRILNHDGRSTTVDRRELRRVCLCWPRYLGSGAGTDARSTYILCTLGYLQTLSITPVITALLHQISPSVGALTFGSRFWDESPFPVRSSALLAGGREEGLAWSGLSLTVVKAFDEMF